MSKRYLDPIEIILVGTVGWIISKFLNRMTKRQNLTRLLEINKKIIDFLNANEKRIVVVIFYGIGMQFLTGIYLQFPTFVLALASLIFTAGFLGIVYLARRLL